MLEGLVATLLNRFLGMYVKNFDAKQLNVGIWSGEVKLRNLELRREALDQLRLPVNVVEGHLGQLTLSIPVSNLRGKPVKVNIEDVFLLAAPKEDAEYNEKDEADRAHAVKMEKLDSAELLKERNTEGLSPEDQKKNQSFMDSLITAVVDNLQVSVKNIHIRYEDSIATPGHPYALGLTLQEFSAVSTDGDWKPTLIQGQAETTHKLAKLGALAFYWNTDATLYGTGKGAEVGAEAQKADLKEMIEKFREAIERGDNHQYMLKPVSGRAALEMDKTGRTDRPKLKARLIFNELGFVLDEDQYRDALMMVDLFHHFIRHQEYRKFRPKSTPKDDPRAWWKFAGDAVLSKIHDRNRQWTSGYLDERRADRKSYIELYKKKKREQTMTAEETQELTRLERKLSYEDLRFWRSLARNQLRKENVGIKKPAQKQSWTAWAWNRGKTQETESKQEQETIMTDEQRKELYNAIDWDEKKALAESVDLPRESVKFQIESNLRTGSFTLKRDPNGARTEILGLMFDNVQAKALQRPDSFLADLSLGSLRVYDGTTEGSLFPQIVKVKDEPSVLGQAQLDSPHGRDEPAQEGTSETASDDALFHLLFEQNPLDQSADSAVTLKLKSIEVIYNPTFILEVAKFFKPPERHMESINALMETAGATVEGLRQQTRAGLEFALEEHKTINAQLDIQAPLIIIPESITQESTLCLIIDAGHVSLNSELVDKDTLRDIQSKQKKKYTDDDYKQLEGLMYDKFLLKLDSTQALIGPGINATKEQLNSEDDPKSLRIIDRINMDFVLETSIIPKATDLTRTRISGHLPVLHASISDRKYKNLMKLIDVAIPKFEDNEAHNGKSKKSVKETKDRPESHQRKAEVMVDRPRSKSIQMQQELVLDEDSEEDDEKAPANGNKQEVNINQRNFEFKFTVDKLRGSLYRSDSDPRQSDQLLVELVAEHFHLDFCLRPYDMIAEVLLKSLKVEDHIDEDPTPEFKEIISSKGFDAEEGKDLFTVKFVKVDPQSPEFQPKYEGVSTNLDVSISTLNLVVTRKTLLTLLDFILLTFTDPAASTALENNAESTEGKQPTAEEGGDGKSLRNTNKIRIKVDLKSITMILNNDGIRLATLSLNSADIGIFLTEKSMRVDARLGSLSLLDDVNQGASADSSLRQLVTIQGDELADFSYQTFDADDDSYPGYDFKVYLRSGSIKVNFLEEAFRKIIDFVVKFGKMQAIFNAARQAAANQASQIQENASKMHFDILVKTPIVVFPRVMVQDRPRDLLTAYLGEIYASNDFVSLPDTDPAVAANKLSAGIRNIRLTSDFHYDKDVSEELELIDKVDLNFMITYLEHQPKSKRPDLEIEGSISPIHLRITQTQLKFLLEVSETVPGAFATDADQVEEEAYQELPKSTVEPARAVTEVVDDDRAPVKAVSHQGPELGTNPESWTKLDTIFRAETIGLELISSKNDEPVRDITAASLSKFSLNDTNIKLRMINDGALESELLIHSFTIKDSRSKETNKFRKIMSLINNDVQQQFMASLSLSAGKDRHLIVMLSIDSPRIIFALDYIFALQAFVNAALASEDPRKVSGDSEDATDLLDDTDSEASTEPNGKSHAKITSRQSGGDTSSGEGSMSMSFRVNIVDAQVILIANPTIANSEAIVLGTKELLLSKQNASTLQITKIGMFLCRMDKFETSRLRILDDFNIILSMDNRSQGKRSSLTSIDVDIEPLVLRLSLRDILLALQIFNKASEMTGRDANKIEDSTPQKIKEVTASSKASLRRKSVTGKPTSTIAKKTNKSVTPSKRPDAKAKGQGSIVLRREELTAKVQGIRVVLIGDLHELPLLDWSVKKFNVDVRDWSSALSGDTIFDTYINVYNFSKSVWEPLIEPWQLGFHMSKDQSPDRLSVELYSHKMMELTITSATIALASKSAQFLSTDEDVLSKPRGADSPYRVRNYTGFDLNVWADSNGEDRGPAAKLSDGEEFAWRFEDPSTMRENLTPEGETGIVGIKLEGSGFDSINRIPVNREGETLYNLKPRKDKVLHRLLVEVKLGTDNVKYITFQSPLLVENKTQIPVEFGVFDPEAGHLLKIEKILPGEGRPAPVGAAFMHSLVIRPDQGFGYSWSNERLFWKDLLKRPTRTITCRGESGDQAPPFYFQMNASYDKSDPMTRSALRERSSLNMH